MSGAMYYHIWQERVARWEWIGNAPPGLRLTRQPPLPLFTLVHTILRWTRTFSDISTPQHVNMLYWVAPDELNSFACFFVLLCSCVSWIILVLFICLCFGNCFDQISQLLPSFNIWPNIGCQDDATQYETIQEHVFSIQGIKKILTILTMQTNETK